MKTYDTEKMIVRLLRVGVLISTCLILLGFILFFLKGDTNTQSINSIKEVLSGVYDLNPYSIIMLGLLVLILTPVLRVLISIIGFYLEKDYLYVKISIIVFTILLVSFFIGVYS